MMETGAKLRHADTPALGSILVVEDDARLAEQICRRLAAAGYAPTVAASGEAALRDLGERCRTLIVLDLGLPDLDGREVAVELRRRADATPIIALTARDAIEDRVSLLQAGADDYIIKPFEPAELLARIQAVLRRRDPKATTVLRLANIAFELPHGPVWIRGQNVVMPKRQAAVLQALLEDAGRVVYRRAISHLTFGDAEATGNTLEAIVSRLRKRLQETGAGVEIHTVRGVGYMATESK